MKILLSIILAFTLIVNQEREVSAYEYPTNTPYIVLVEQTLGEIKVYIPQNQVEVLQVTENYTNVINVSSGSVYGYFTKGSIDYRITFTTLENGTYRTIESNYGTQTELKIKEIKETNIPHLKKIEDRSGFDLIHVEQETMLIMFCICMLGLVALLWLKH